MPGNPSPPTRYWVLETLPGPVIAQDVRTLLLVGPFSFPGYLDRRELVTRGEGGQIQIAAFDSWGEELNPIFNRVLARNLEVLVPGTRAAVFPWKGPRPGELQLAGVVTRFEVASDKAAHLVVTWTLTQVSDKAERGIGSSTIREPLDGQSISAEVAALSRALASLAREIAVPLAEAD